MEKLRKFGMRWFLLMVAALAMGVTMSACGDDDDDEPAGGTTVNGYQVTGVWASEEDMSDGYNPVFAVKLNADGTGEDGEWDLDTETFECDGDRWRWRVDGSKMEITEPDGESRWESFEIYDGGKAANIGGDIFVKVR